MRTLFDDIDEPCRSIQERFERFHREHPEVYDLFKRFAGELKRAGRKRYSADAILHRVRWNYAVGETRGGDFKINDHYSSRYARLLVQERPEFDGFFETRELRTA